MKWPERLLLSIYRVDKRFLFVRSIGLSWMNFSFSRVLGMVLVGICCQLCRMDYSVVKVLILLHGAHNLQHSHTKIFTELPSSIKYLRQMGIGQFRV